MSLNSVSKCICAYIKRPYILIIWKSLKTNNRSVHTLVLLRGWLLCALCHIQRRWEFSFLSSYCWGLVANAPNILQSYWLIVLSLDVPVLTTSLLYEILAARGGIIYRPYFLDVPSFATSRLRGIVAAKGGTMWARNGRWILPDDARLPRNIQGYFTCRKSTT
jgi:hypothetical protein